MLNVKGDSMIQAGIFNGDQIIVEQRQDVRSGDIVVAILDDSATVKTYYREKGHIRLQPENDSLDPIIVEPGQPIQIVGKVIGVLRFMR